jgi:hypothetical protein
LAQAKAATAPVYHEPATIGRECPSGSDHLRWTEDPAACGLRFVGFADDIARVDHTGWYCDEFQDRTLRGVVYQLPARNGRTLYVYGYTSSDDCGTRGWPRAAALNFRDVTAGPAADDQDDTRREVAVRADQMAETAAEREREYNAAWRAGQDFADANAQVAAAMAERRALLAEVRSMGKHCKRTHPVAYRAAEARIIALRATIADARATMQRAVNGETWYRSETLIPAFLDGAGLARPPRMASWARKEG